LNFMGTDSEADSVPNNAADRCTDTPPPASGAKTPPHRYRKIIPLLPGATARGKFDDIVPCVP